MPKKYRVKAFIFVRAHSPQEAESLAKDFVDLSKKSPDIPFEVSLRPGSAKEIVEEAPKEKANG
jgi:hypothetical protein